MHGLHCALLCTLGQSRNRVQPSQETPSPVAYCGEQTGAARRRQASARPLWRHCPALSATVHERPAQNLPILFPLLLNRIASKMPRICDRRQAGDECAQIRGILEANLYACSASQWLPESRVASERILPAAPSRVNRRLPPVAPGTSTHTLTPVWPVIRGPRCSSPPATPYSASHAASLQSTPGPH